MFLVDLYERLLWGPLTRRYTAAHHRPEEARMPSVRTVDELEAILLARNTENAALRAEVRALKAELRGRELCGHVHCQVAAPPHRCVRERGHFPATMHGDYSGFEWSAPDGRHLVGLVGGGQ